MDPYEEIVRLRRAGRKAVLATIVRHTGSTPRKDHAKMLIREDGSCLGTVGGGSVEAEVIEQARQVLESGQARTVRFQLTRKDAESEGLTCGGTMEVFMEPIGPDPRAVLLGAGHLGQAIAEALHRIGFRIVVVDDRADFASRERFAMAEEIVVSPFESALDSVRIGENCFVLIMTRGHGYDEVVLEQAIVKPARYVGMVGSRRKIKTIIGKLLERGVPAQAFSKLYAPIGLDVGAETPEEIAAAVAAELIAVQKGVHRRSDKQQFALKVARGEASGPRPVASA